MCNKTKQIKNKWEKCELIDDTYLLQTWTTAKLVNKFAACYRKTRLSRCTVLVIKTVTKNEQCNRMNAICNLSKLLIIAKQ